MSANEQAVLPDIQQTVTMNAPVGKVWDAVATSEGIAAWFMPNDFKAELGSEFSIQSPYGVQTCKVTEIDPPHKLTFTWGPEWHITFLLSDVNGQTEFTLIHGGWKDGANPQTGMPNAAIRDTMNNGWGSTVLVRLKQFVEA